MMTHLAALRDVMTRDGIDILLIPHNDLFQSEYLPPHEERLAWLSGFTGSWGFIIVTHDAAHLFVDGRYTLQAPQQVDTAIWTIHEVPALRPTHWLDKNLQPGQTVALEGWRFTVNSLAQTKAIIARRKGNTVVLDNDIIASLWTDRPATPSAPAFAHDIMYAGRSTADKISTLQAFITEHALDGYLITDPGHVCWLLNMRGRDITHMPILLCMAFVGADGSVMVFAAPGKIDSALQKTWDLSAVSIHDFADLQAILTEQAAHTIGLDPNHAPAILAQILKDAGKDIHNHECPVELSRAIKNDIEVAGSRQAHIRDAVAVCNTLHWIATHPNQSSLTEQDIVDTLDGQRAKQDLFVETSFSSITGSGAHGAIVHYHVTPDTNQPLQNNSLLLIDGGGQYRDGTTDITRTVSIGTPDAAMIADYTSVLQGHIALTVARFPVGTSGAALDTLARAPLWTQGRHYTHGTGHGIGSFMGTHEGPQGFSPRSPCALHAGMLITNEPGYYKTGHYGIRLENVVVVIDVTRDSDDQPMLGLDYLTLVPFEADLIDFARLSTGEKDWLRTYHQQVLDTVSPLLDTDVAAWLTKQCRAFLN